MKLKFIRKILSCQKFLRPKTREKQKVSTDDRMQLTVHIPSPNHHWKAIQGILGQRSTLRKYLPSEKIWVFKHSVRNSPAKKFRPPKLSASVIYDFGNGAKQKTNEPYECVCGKWASKFKEMQCTEGKTELVSKRLKKSALFWQKIPEKKLAIY